MQPSRRFHFTFSAAEQTGFNLTLSLRHWRQLWLKSILKWIKKRWQISQCVDEKLIPQFIDSLQVSTFRLDARMLIGMRFAFLEFSSAFESARLQGRPALFHCTSGRFKRQWTELWLTCTSMHFHCLDTSVSPVQLDGGPCELHNNCSV